MHPQRKTIPVSDALEWADMNLKSMVRIDLTSEKPRNQCNEEREDEIEANEAEQVKRLEFFWLDPAALELMASTAIGILGAKLVYAFESQPHLHQ
jgi:hypothetical protein